MMGRTVETPHAIFFGAQKCACAHYVEFVMKLYNEFVMKLTPCHDSRQERNGDLGFKCLQTLDLSDCEQLDQLPPLSTIIALQELKQCVCRNLRRVPSLEGLKCLATLYL